MLVFLNVVLVVMLVACVYQSRKADLIKLWDAVKEVTAFLFSKEYLKEVYTGFKELLEPLSKPFIFVGGVLVILCLIIHSAVTGKDWEL